MLNPHSARSSVPTVIWLVAIVAVALAGLGSAPAPASSPAAGPEVHGAAGHDPHGVRLDRRAAITARFPSAVPTGKRIRVAGTARLRGGARRAPRPVRLVERASGRWVTRAKTTTNRTGGFVLTTRAGARQRTRTFKVVAPRFRGLSRASTPRSRVAVVPPTAPDAPDTQVALGDPNDWRFLFAGGARWNPCAPIEWAYNPDGQPYAGALDDVHESLRRIAARTGLAFDYAGTTDYTHFVDDKDDRPANAQFFVAWANEAQVPLLAGTVVGIGGGSARSVDGEDVAKRITSGHLVLDKGHRLRTGHDVTGTPTWGQVIDHEALHAVGLGHAVGREQLMYGSVSSLNHRFGAGDLTGMARIGSTHGCL